MPAVALLIVVVLSAATAGSAYLQAADGARVAVRAAAIGESAASVTAVGAAGAGPGADIGIRREGEWVTVTVTQPVHADWFPAGLNVSASARARVEPGP